ncbi:Retinol dehydrogenase 8 [Apiospora saccharicola]|uniref:Retinol dehydrogenase 8 n=1 Tax=Apiospora saccharicola TaxID=335842 RepID=A0ABR1TKA3_9PEZI
MASSVNDITSSETKSPLTWLITGCSSGFGLQFARHALAAGHRVIATSRDPSKTPALVSEIEGAKPPGRGRWLQLDTSAADCGALIDRLETGQEEADGPHPPTAVNVLVNSAGFAITGPVEGFADQEVCDVMETNFFGPYRLMRAALPHMRRRRRGVIVNLSSGSGLEARHALGVYGASKAALDGISKTLAKEVAEFGIRVLQVYMGSFDTPMGHATKLVEQPLDPDYENSMVGKTIGVFQSGQFQALGDHKKAVRAIYDVVVGEGAGAGLGREVQMMLGKECAVRAIEVRDGLNHMLETFGEVCNGVDLD